MSKVLKPYTIIPTDLYVQRDADRQIKNIISDMGRPGYVLVSRQMGKTNLLLNAKRKLETPDDVFVYVDLSNPFENAKSCFENIIDTALETNPEKFEAVQKIILERRKELLETPPHKQHTNELRLLLKSISGKLVIILDEIDALTKTNYSDQIFAQIRSIYFSRVNFKELEKLTYILSGVIEPTEIIKDPKISPFNIGQKIFLNDFSREEFEQFLNNSQLDLNQKIRDRIFYWTNGNPRMTWDVCSEVENQNKIHQLSEENIDRIVSDIYLTTFDKPPIDNIRELVRKDREIRNAIVEIEYQKGKEVSDKVKSKLYLSGIINYEENDIHIKNQIIKESLNLEWIKSLEEEDKGLVRVAIEFFETENYIEALNTFERFLSENNFEEADKSLCYYYMGYASYRNSDFTKAIQYLNKSTFDVEEDAKWYYRVLNLKGLAYYYHNQIDDSLQCFKEVMNSGRKDEIYVRALLNFGSIALKSQKLNHKDEAIKIFNEIIDESGFNKEKLTDNFVKELKSIAHYNLAQIQNTNGEYEKAIENYRQAIQLGKINTKPAIILALLEITKTTEDKFDLLNQLINLISEGKIKPIEKDPEKPIDFSFDELKDIVISTYKHFPDSLFEKIKPHLFLLGNKTISKHLYDLAIYVINKNKDWDMAILLLNGIYKNNANDEYALDKETKYNTLKLLSYFSRTPESPKHSIEYLSLFAKERLAVIDYLDMEIFANLIYSLTEKKRFQDALRYVALINSVKEFVPENILINYLVIYHLELNLYFNLNQRQKAISKAEEIISLANDDKIKQQNSNLLGETGLDIIKKNAESILHPIARVQTPFKSEKTYGRNQIIKVRYKDGTTLETKFKKVENDLKKGECYILN